jgi:hypothetical protein
MVALRVWRGIGGTLEIPLDDSRAFAAQSAISIVQVALRVFLLLKIIGIKDSALLQIGLHNRYSKLCAGTGDAGAVPFDGDDGRKTWTEEALAR